MSIVVGMTASTQRRTRTSLSNCFICGPSDTPRMSLGLRLQRLQTIRAGAPKTHILGLGEELGLLVVLFIRAPVKNCGTIYPTTLLFLLKPLHKSPNEAAQLRRTMSQNFDADKPLGLSVRVEVHWLL